VAQRPVYTIGHSTRTADELIALLDHNGVRLLVDVRRYPGSRRNPQFAREPLAAALDAAGIRYRHAPELGGRRDPAPGSPNTGLRNAGFRAYADHMASPPFQAELDRLVAELGRTTVAIMCAEAVPWRCHRNMISDALTARGVEVRHIIGDAEPSRHELHRLARVDEHGRLTYPPPPAAQRELF
jgi:uncharacterized protein (DUF488 family)